MPWTTCSECGGVGTTRHNGERALCRSCSGGGWVRHEATRQRVSVDSGESNSERGRKSNGNDRNRMEIMNSKSGSFILIGALIGLVGSAVVTYFSAATDAQTVANQTGKEVSVMDMIDGGDAVQALIATGAGAAVGWGADQLKSNDKEDKKPVPTMQINSGRDTVVTVGGDDASGSNSQHQPIIATTTTTTPAPEATP